MPEASWGFQYERERERCSDERRVGEVLLHEGAGQDELRYQHGHARHDGRVTPRKEAATPEVDRQGSCRDEQHIDDFCGRVGVAHRVQQPRRGNDRRVGEADVDALAPDLEEVSVSEILRELGMDQFVAEQPRRGDSCRKPELDRRCRSDHDRDDERCSMDAKEGTYSRPPARPARRRLARHLATLAQLDRGPASRNGGALASSIGLRATLFA